MKKLVAGIFAIVAVLCLSLTALAGDIPYCLLYEDEAQIFFAEVTEYKGTYVNVIPVKVVKGDVKLGEEVRYDQATLIGEFSVKKGMAYLFARVDENDYTYIFRVSDYDTQTLDLIDVKPDEGMWGIFETDLNTGEYDKAESARRGRLELSEHSTQISGDLPPLHTKLTKDNTMTYVLCGFGIIALASAIVFIVQKKKK